MPLQNRVTPFGDIVAIEQRGLFTGNRGILHDPATRTLLNKRWASKAWIICRLQYKNKHRVPMATRSWTELFFLDEAVALSAGHRPCFYCRRPDAEVFRQAWLSARGETVTSACQMDEVLHAERLTARVKPLHPLQGPVASLPDGAMLASAGSALVIVGGQAFAWTIDGYQPAPTTTRFDGLLTPPSTLGALRAGYRPGLHPSLLRPQMRRQIAEVEQLLNPSQVQITAEDPTAAGAIWCIEQYYAEVARRFDNGFDPAISRAVNPRELMAPAGALLIARLHGQPIGCLGIKLHKDAPAELKRMWVSPETRGLGVGRRLLQQAETLAKNARYRSVRLDTNRALVEAIALYRRCGYQEVAAFNDEPYAHHWFEKPLG